MNAFVKAVEAAGAKGPGQIVETTSERQSEWMLDHMHIRTARSGLYSLDWTYLYHTDRGIAYVSKWTYKGVR